MNKKITSDNYATFWVIECKSGYLRARVDIEADIQSDILEEIIYDDYTSG